MIPAALAGKFPLTETTVAARRIPGKQCDTICLLDKSQVTSGDFAVEFVGTYESIVEQLLAAHPSTTPGCTAITVHPYRQNELCVWHKPYYTGSDEDVVLHLLQKYGEVYVPDKNMRGSLRKQFSFIYGDICNGGDHRLYLLDRVKAASKAVSSNAARAARVRQKRIATGNVIHNDVTWLYYQFYNAISAALRPTYTKLHTDLGLHHKDVYMRGTVGFVKVARKLGILRKIEKKYLKALVPFLPGLLKHPDQDYRNYGKCLKSVFKQRRIK